MKKTILLLTFLQISNWAIAQRTFNFSECLHLMEGNNLSIKNAALNEEIAIYGLKTKKGKLLPSISGATDNKYSWGREIDPTTNSFVNKDFKSYTGNLTANYNLFSGFYNLKSIQIGKQEVAITALNLKKTKEEMALDLAQKYITVLYLQETLVVNQEQIEASNKQLEIAQLKFDSGVIAESEVFKMHAQKSIEELTLISNQNRLATSLLELKQLMNLPLETEIKLEKPSITLFENNLLNEPMLEMTKKAVQLHPSFQMYQLMESKAKKEMALSKSFYFPTLNLKYNYGSSYSTNDPEIAFKEQFSTNLVTSLKLSLVIPIFNQLETTYRIKQNKLSFEQSKIKTKIEENRITKMVLQAISDTKASSKKQEAATIAFKYAQKSYESDRLKYELGKININELNTTKTNYQNAQSELIKAKYELILNTALIRYYLGEEFTF